MAPQEQTTMIKLPGMAAAALLFSGAVIAQDPEQMETVLVTGLCGRSAGRPGDLQRLAPRNGKRRRSAGVPEQIVRSADR